MYKTVRKFKQTPVLPEIIKEVSFDVPHDPFQVLREIFASVDVDHLVGKAKILFDGGIRESFGPINELLVKSSSLKKPHRILQSCGLSCDSDCLGYGFVLILLLLLCSTIHCRCI